MERQENIETLVYFWQKVCEKETKLNKIFTLFGCDQQGKVFKNKFWLAAEKLGANLAADET